jgi:hypothetical protein
MADNVIRLVPNSVGDAYKINPDEVLGAWMGDLETCVLVGVTTDGELIVAGTGSAAESLLLLAQGSASIVEGSMSGE